MLNFSDLCAKLWFLGLEAAKSPQPLPNPNPTAGSA